MKRTRIGMIVDSMGVERPPSQVLFLSNLVENLSKLTDLALIRSRKNCELMMKHFSDVSWFFSPPNLRKLRLDIIHYPSLGGGRSPPILCSLLKSNVVVTLHGIDIATVNLKHYFDKKSYFWRRFLLARSIFDYRLLEKDEKFHLVTVSESEKRNISERLGFPNERIHVVHHGVDHNKFKPCENVEGVTNEIRQRYGIDGPFILHVSNCAPKKNVMTLVKAFSILRRKLRIRHKLVICGAKTRDFQSIMKLVSSLSLNEGIVHTGHVSDADLPKFYNVADLFVFPSLHESFGLPLLEAMSSGCPVITSNFHAMPEVTGNAAILVNPLDVEELVSSMHNVLYSKTLRQELRHKGLMRARLFSWEKCAKEYLKIYEEVSQL